MHIFMGVLAPHDRGASLNQYLTFGILPRILAYQPGFWHIHRESVSGEAGFRLGFVYRSARRVGSDLYQSASILYQAEGTVMGGQHTHENVHSGRS